MKKRIIILAVIELLVMAFLLVLVINSRSAGREVLNPGLTSWESRYVSGEGGIFAGDPSIYPEGLSEGEEIDFIYGPYFSLPAGNYSVSIDYECEAPQTFEVYSYKSGSAVFKHEPEKLTSDKTTQTYHFTLLKAVDDLEIRIHYNGNGAIKISNINVVASSFLVREIVLAVFLLFVFADICVYLYVKQGPKAGDGRKLWIDVCRGVGIILVLLGHAESPFKWLIFGFHMPLFFILSGYLYKGGRKASEYISGLFKRYMIPYFVLAFLNLIVRMFQMYFEDGLTKEWVGRFIFLGIADAGEWLPNCVSLWFLTALFLAMAGMYLIHEKLMPFQRFIVVLLCLAGAVLMDRFNCPNVPFNVGQAMMGIVFAEVGWILKKYDIIKKTAQLKAADKIGLFAVILICGVDAVWYNYSLGGEITAMLSMRYEFVPLWLMGAVFISVCVMALCYRICSLPLSGLTVPLGALGRHTMIFFGFDFCMAIYSTRILQAYFSYSPWHFEVPVRFLLLLLLFLLGRIAKLDKHKII
ncbi:MAG: acyltransferase family protein [Lachnospiraceae bacterium]|nr:acyltransferase family protein [Lachnospiraceae bacterium]